MRCFSYLQDRLFILSLMAYALNRLVIRPHLNWFIQSYLHWAWPLLHSHFDDLLLMPVALPVVLWLQRLGGLRTHDRPPGWGEAFFHFVIWSVMCKVVGPGFFKLGVADPWDILFFAAGGVAACFWWNRRAFQLSPAQP